MALLSAECVPLLEVGSAQKFTFDSIMYGNFAVVNFHTSLEMLSGTTSYNALPQENRSK
jgi:hypothetical protein